MTSEVDQSCDKGDQEDGEPDHVSLANSLSQEFRPPEIVREECSHERNETSEGAPHDPSIRNLPRVTCEGACHVLVLRPRTHPIVVMLFGRSTQDVEESLNISTHG